jgi:adenylate kinase family enzyme
LKLSHLWTFFFGCSGAGKTDQATEHLVPFLEDELGSCAFLDMGQHIRDEIKRNSPLLTEEDHVLIEQGKLITDPTICQMSVPQLQAVPDDVRARVVLGWPRNLTQSQDALEMIRSLPREDYVVGVYFEASVATCWRRMGTQGDRNASTKSDAARNKRISEWREHGIPAMKNLENAGISILTINAEPEDKKVIALETRLRLIQFLRPTDHSPRLHLLREGEQASL